MAGIPMYYHRNYNSSDNETYTSAQGYTILSIQDLGWTAEEGHSFKEWNTRSDGLGASREIGETIVDDDLYAIWEINYDVTISYKGSIIAGMSSSGTKTLETEGTYCEDDIAFSVQFPTLDTSDATVTTSYMRASKTAYGASGKITGTIPNFNGSITIT